MLPFVYGLEEVAGRGWSTTAVVALTVAGVAFVYRQRRLETPLLDLGLFGIRTVWGALLVGATVAFVQGGTASTSPNTCSWSTGCRRPRRGCGRCRRRSCSSSASSWPRGSRLPCPRPPHQRRRPVVRRRHGRAHAGPRNVERARPCGRLVHRLRRDQSRRAASRPARHHLGPARQGRCRIGAQQHGRGTRRGARHSLGQQLGDRCPGGRVPVPGRHGDEDRPPAPDLVVQNGTGDLEPARPEPRRPLRTWSSRS